MSERLGRFERDILVAVAQLGRKGYSVNIADKAEQLTGTSVSLGAVYATVDRLQKKGLVESRLAEATPERGGKPKRYYWITAPGERALAEARAADAKIWGAVGGVTA
jgi:PadR family transcriptional regulator PadR